MNLFVSALFLGLFSFSLYFITLAPTVVWGDPAKLTNFAHLNYLNIHSASHPFHCLLGYWWGKLPFLDYAYGQNLLSAIFASMTVFFLFFVVYRLTKSIFASIIAALSLSVAHTFWWLAVVNESYSFAFFCLALALLAAVAWAQTKKPGWLYLSAFALGMGISDHYMLAVLAPAFAVGVLIDDPRLIFDFKKILISICFFVLGAGLLAYIYFTQHPSLAWVNMVESTDIESRAKILRELVRFPLYVFYQFPLIGFVLGAIGLWQSCTIKRGIFSLLLGLFLINYIFSALYMWQRQPEMMVFGYLVFAVWIGLGIDYLEKKMALSSLKSKLLLLSAIILIPILLYSYAPYFAQKNGGNLLHVRSLPFRNNDEYFLNPNKRGYDGARRYGEEVFKAVKPNAIIIADFTPFTVLNYMQTVEKKRPDIKLVYPKPGSDNPVKGVVENNIGRVPIYIADIDNYQELYGIKSLQKEYVFGKTGPIYRIMRRGSR